MKMMIFIRIQNEQHISIAMNQLKLGGFFVHLFLFLFSVDSLNLFQFCATDDLFENTANDFE